MNKIDIKVTGNKENYLLLRLHRLNIAVHNVKYFKEYMILTVNETDYENIVKFNSSQEISIYKYRGLKQLKKQFQENLLFISYNIIALLLIMILSSFIVKVDIVHENKEIREMITKELNDYKLRSGSYKKSYDELQEIKNAILDNHQKDLEWLEITRVGMKYVVNVEERIIIDKVSENEYCNIIATKSGIITNLAIVKGQTKVSLNDYVKPGDVLVSGEIKLNDAVKNYVCASGDVYAEVWYTVTINIPIKLVEKVYTDKHRYNLSFDTRKSNTKIFRPQYSNYETTKIKMFSLFGVTVYIDKEFEYIATERDFSENELANYAEKLALEKINLKLKDKETIISKKVLKNTIINSTMNMELFIVVSEKIGRQEIALKKEAEVQ